ncbi:MAG: LacI family transcriptional regulator [Lachnospiraceae bacterium]|nr:LacI family transcriptional regulator [Lachnospiraceae bacterium]
MDAEKNESVNIYDIAEMANVSIATVSRVVNGSDKVSPATRRKVEEIIKEVGYKPNAFAKGLGLNTMHTVGILTPNVADAFMAAAVYYLEQEMRGYGYDCLLSCSGFQPEGKRNQLDLLLSKHVDALVLVGSTYAGSGKDSKETDYIREAAKKVPVFLINGSVRGRNVYVTVCDDTKAVRSVTESLIACGCKDILFMTDSRSYSANKKRSGYEEAMQKTGLPLRQELIRFVRNDIGFVREYLHREKPVFDAVVATEDGIAIGVLKYAADLGIRVPEELQIVGYNDSRMALACEPELSSIDNGLKMMCIETVRRLMDILQGRRADKKTVVPCQIIERGTTRFLKR